MKTKIIIFIILCVSSIGIYTISSRSQTVDFQNTDIKNIPQSTWNSLSSKKIFFGHHSVGTNILHGIETILKDNKNINLTIINLKKIGNTIDKPSLVHGNVGKNTNPESKINSFRKIIEAGYGQNVDIAFFKFCFVDFTPKTNVNKLFQYYKSTMDILIKEYPKTTFVAMTTPLTCYAPGVHGWVKRAKDALKKALGKLNIYDHRSANIFNKLLIQEYKGKIPIFDLAKIESTKPDGSRVSYKKGNTTYYELVQEYTTDGGHLNKIGQQIVAEKFLLFLADLAKQQDTTLLNNMARND